MKTNPLNAPDAVSPPATPMPAPSAASTQKGLQPPPGAPAIKPDGIRDTIDSIVVAFILAFVFRAFIVEAFVIPTGSMAPSLYGMHGQHRCSKCGYSFAYGIREPAADPSGQIHAGTLVGERGERQYFSVRCPNCTWDGRGNARLNTSNDPVAPDSGDRILVLKWPYDFGGALLGPQRWDVVVFKNPQDGEVNFIKRLIGLPGEVLQIMNGDVYSAPLNSIPAEIRSALEVPPEKQGLSGPLTIEQLRQLAKYMKVQRKTRVAQDSLWMLHFDQDYLPVDRTPDIESRYFDPPYWEERNSGSRPAWDTASPVIRFRPADADRHWLDLRGCPIQDEYGYNNVNFRPGGPTPPRAVGDVQLKLVLFPAGSEGKLILQLRKGVDQFQTLLSADGDVRLEKFNTTIRDGFWQEILKTRMTPMAPGRPIDIEFENLDFRVALRINGEEILATDDSQYAPNMDAFLQQPYEDGRNSQSGVSIAAEKMSFDIRHLRILRDVFYRSDRIIDAGDFADRAGWGTATNPILLRAEPAEFFCCGDNSPQSKDSRLWVDVCGMLKDRHGDEQYHYGTVPGDQMIGRAFFVYWPSGLRFSRDTMAVIPNVGRMRLIR